MSEDDQEMSKRDTKESVLDSDEMEQLGAFPNFPEDQADLAKTQEIDAMDKRGLETEPDHDSLDSTQIYEIPADLLQMSMRSQEMPILPQQDDDEPEWREFIAIVDPRGRIVLPSRVQQQLRGKKLRVKYVVDGE